MEKSATFLTATWSDLAMLNFSVDPEILGPRVPRGTEIDVWNGRTFVSVVGFRFVDTLVLGIAIPGHRDFDEVNLRFYVRRRAADGWRGGVVFVREIVPRRVVAWIARALYNESYVALPMRHEIVPPIDGRVAGGARYEWKLRGRWQHLSMTTGGESVIPTEHSLEDFLVNRRWGYTRQRDGGTIEYEVEHERWAIRTATVSAFDCDVTTMYGAPFAPFLHRAPDTAFLADGSAITVSRGVRI